MSRLRKEQALKKPTPKGAGFKGSRLQRQPVSKKALSEESRLQRKPASEGAGFEGAVFFWSRLRKKPAPN